MERYPMTAEGLDRLEKELKNLKSVERPAVIKAIATAREHGDLKENAEYHAAREKQGFIESRITHLTSVTSFAEVIDVSTMSGTVVRFGAKVVVYDETTDAEVEYHVVGTHEADIALNRLSITAPLARALLGKTIGDVVEVVTPGGKKSYEVCNVNFG